VRVADQAVVNDSSVQNLHWSDQHSCCEFPQRKAYGTTGNGPPLLRRSVFLTCSDARSLPPNDVAKLLRNIDEIIDEAKRLRSQIEDTMPSSARQLGQRRGVERRRQR
jgi:hypothetical protein